MFCQKLAGILCFKTIFFASRYNVTSTSLIYKWRGKQNVKSVFKLKTGHSMNVYQYKKGVLVKIVAPKHFQNIVFICQLFSLSVRVHSRGSPRNRMSTWRILFCCRNRRSKAYSLSLYSRVYRQKMSISGGWSRASWQWTLTLFWTNSIAKLIIEVVMLLIILTSKNKTTISESDLRLFMRFKGFFVWLTKTQKSIYLLIHVVERIRANSPETKNLWVVAKLVLFPAAFIIQQIISVSVH